ncbi:MAG: energy-coupling factor ABC transporter ATP-binding protein [Spirochaetaceae bacterium]|jgi:biotin transport system ATP-binding protein|nr:energy-coupling factor ABC transporter ATP-binding protein [Spirochaetaceae bacterium]
MTLVNVQNLTKVFRIAEYTDSDRIRDGKFYALDNVSLCIKSGECAVIAGSSGSGKSLLMAIIAKLEDPSSGSIEISGKVGLVFQNSDSQILGETAVEDITISVRNQKIPKKETNAFVEKVLSETGLSEKAFFPARFLSGGEKRRLAVAAVLAMNADIIIFDEPYTNLDYPGVVQINKLIVDLKESHKTIIILTHELEKCLRLADCFIVLNQGKVVFNGTPAEGLTQNLADWGIHHPLGGAKCLEDLLWL